MIVKPQSALTAKMSGRWHDIGGNVSLIGQIRRCLIK